MMGRKPASAVEKTRGGRVKSLSTALALFSEFLANDHEFGITDLVNRTKMPKGQISKILATFRDHGFLRQDEKTRRYSVGLRTFLLGCRFANQDRLTSYALPMMREMAQDTGHSVRLSVMDNDSVVYLMGIEGPAFVDTGWRAGTYLPLHSTTAGRIVLAFIDESRAKKLIDDLDMVKFTPYTITDKEELRRSIARIRITGSSTQRGETNAGLATTAVPIFGEGQQVIGVLGFAFPSHAVTGAEEKGLIDVLHRYSRVLSLRMGSAVYPFGHDRKQRVATRQALRS
jgi:DNA-binding IclR family transcriptional regulator